jgi:hypothetical protein
MAPRRDCEEQDGAGSGFGLWLCKGIVELHGGRISVQSAGEGHGSTFTVELPMWRDTSLATAGEPLSDPRTRDNTRVASADHPVTRFMPPPLPAPRDPAAAALNGIGRVERGDHDDEAESKDDDDAPAVSSITSAMSGKRRHTAARCCMN